MNRGYDSTSISVLQEELNMSRGAMYRYFRNKEELFFAVIDTYFFGLFEKLLKNANGDLTAEELIEFIYRRQRLVMNAFTRAGITHTAFLNYTALMIQGAKHYPKFLDRFYVVNKRLLEVWRNSLLKSIEIGEVKAGIDIDIMCILFNSISIKESSDRYTDDSMFAVNIMHDMERRKEVMDYLYSLIRS